MSAPALIYVDTEGSLREWTRGGDRLLAQAWEDSRYAWPCFRPDGRSLACFNVSGDEGELLQVEAAGRQMTLLYREERTRPIYAAWSPEGRRLALLVQGSETLRLVLVDPDRPGAARPLCEGGPIFFAWAPDGSALAVHRGDGPGQGSELLLFEVDGPSRPRRLAETPGSFRAPAWSVRGDLAYLVAGDAGELLVVRRADGSEETLIARPRVSAFVWSPGGEALAVGMAGEERSSFGRIEVVRTSRSVERIEAEDAVAFGWLARERGLWVAAIEPTQMCLVLGRADSTGTTTLGRFVPSEETLYQLSFFDQYAHSHPLLAPDGAAIAFCGHPAGGASAPEEAQVFVIAVDGAAPLPVAWGGVATWRPG